MPVVPGDVQTQLASQWDQEQRKRPTPEHLLMAAADMHNRGQLIQPPTQVARPSAKPGMKRQKWP